jgi:uncharacterized protein (TIGR03067 family)
MRAAVALVLAFAATAGADDKSPLKAIEGECALVSFEGKGLKGTKAETRKLSIARRDATVTENSITAEFAGTRATYTYKLDATKTPPHIDLTRTINDKTETNHGIYKVEDGVLTICATEADKPEMRPKEFKTGRDVYLMVIRKRHELEGAYTLVGMAAKGLTLTEADLNKVPAAERRLVIDDDEVILMFNGKDERGTFSFDKSKTPHRIDLGLTRDNKTEVSPGIYTFEKEVLTICASTSGESAKRPTEIKPGDNVTVFTLTKLPRK